MAAPRSMNELDTPVVFYSRTDAADEAGAPEPVWASVAVQTYAKEELGAAAEGEVADQEVSFSRATFWIRARSGVSNTMRVTRNGQLFAVMAVDVFGRSQWMRVLCEKVNDG